MRFSCELVVTDILPIARRELARELIVSHGLTQSEVAKMFGVTSPAISQYMSGKRGRSETVFGSSFAESFTECIVSSAEMLAKGDSDVLTELCRICDLSKCSGALSEMNRSLGETEECIKCLECPRTDYDGQGKNFTFR